ncbi:MAG TPA: hypothetical protein VMV10_04435 [Pirellulales bacterium]|nr:hypothetical protein [Pirellulales bacterium]
MPILAGDRRLVVYPAVAGAGRVQIRIGIDQDRTDPLVVVFVFDRQHQQAGLRGDGDFHFVVDLQPCAADPVLFSHEHSQPVAQPGLLGPRQQPVLAHVAIQDFEPGVGKRLGQQLLPAALLGSKEHRCEVVVARRKFEVRHP